MKLSHRDFRPQKRSKFVSQPPVKRPTLRVLILFVFGIIVYLKFDSFVSSRVIQMVRHPSLLLETFSKVDSKQIQLPSAINSTVSVSLKWSSDSLEANLFCNPGPLEACLMEAQRLSPLKLDSHSIGGLRALIHKAQLQWQLDPVTGFGAHFKKDLEAPEGTTVMLLNGLDLSTAKGTIALLTQFSTHSTRYCMQERCLDQLFPMLPIEKAMRIEMPTSRPPRLELKAASGVVFHPILPGWIVAFNPDSQEVKVYHGKNIFSSYAGFKSLYPGLKVGRQLRMEDTLGIIGDQEDSVGHLSLFIEQNGLYIQPEDFLSVDREATESANGN